ncbi:MAG: molybdopterin-dependent oxidoreductase [Armatimonadota bacterium]|nr:molybdopterin-dependent oxidoreductase [Armatimonadota bacterium]MDR7471039.1 molybdopterin-dependent oxidoreductase [Armatimonadota bacterium]MDR7475735.1 molybdopterin-dependent oxidoreductase [Armatimonadota bacterium]MDR7538277.1 molybdopterin-dependent oxidoreductase [Armatimonadota bacterium]
MTAPEDGGLRIAAAEDVWIPTVCYGCYNGCGIRVRRVDGRIVDVEGDPGNPGTRGYICAKAKARVFDLYDPTRVVHPLRRRNPEKGVGVDPMWEPISWEEALEEIAARLKRIRRDDPRKLIIAHFDLPAAPLVRAWATAFGTPHSNWMAGGLFCGMGSHAVNMLINGAYNSEVDFERCNHLVLWGTQMGFMADSNATVTTRKVAEARKRGMKVTVIDPVMNTAAAKADAWIPIRPGTDGALALAILQVLLNELAVFDDVFLRRRTNACYLVRPSGTYARHLQNDRPLVWNLRNGRSEPFDICPWEDAALEGCFAVEGEWCHTAFSLLRAHVRAYEPERVAVITTVPAPRIRALAAELAEDAHIGETITIDDQVLPLRPVAVNFKMGAVGHKHGFATALAIHLINVVLGSIDVPGGFLGVNPIGPFWEPDEGPDGLLVASGALRNLFGANPPFPGMTVQSPESYSLREILPVAVAGRTLYPFTLLEPEKFGLSYRPEMLLHSRVNLMMSMVSPPKMAEVLRRIPFMVSFAIQLDETAEFADIVLPDAHDFERDDLFPASHPYAFVAPGPGDWYWTLRRAVVPPAGAARPWGEVLIDLAHRAEFAEDFYEMCNLLFELRPTDRLDPAQRHTVGAIASRQVTSFAARLGVETPSYEGTSAWTTGRRSVREAFPGPYVGPRLPIYAEHLLNKGHEVRKAVEAMPVPWDLKDYRPLPDWLPSAAHEELDPAYDLYAVTYKVPFLTLSVGSHNPWLDELARQHPSAYRILINTRTAQRRGINDGDWIEVRSRVGSVVGRARLSHGIHPEAVAIAGIHGHWAARSSIAQGGGVHFNTLLPLDLNSVDKLSSAFDSKAKVAVRKIRPPARR